MGKRDKSKMRDEEDVFWGHDGTYVDIEGTQDLRDRSPLPSNPPPGPKWQAKQGMARLPLNGAEYAVLACLIDRASKNKGACYPSQEFIRRWTFRPLRTVERAIAALNEKGVIRSIPRGTTSNAYIINWPPLFAAYRQMKAMERKGEHSASEIKTIKTPSPKVAGHAAKSGGSYPPKVAAKPMKRTYEEEPMTLSASSGDEAYLVVLDKKKERAFVEEPVERLSPSPQTPEPTEGPSSYSSSSSSEAQRERAEFDAHTRLEADLIRLPRPLNDAVLQWLPYPGEVYNAAIAAEVGEPSAGVVVVLDAYRKEKAA